MNSPEARRRRFVGLCLSLEPPRIRASFRSWKNALLKLGARARCAIAHALRLTGRPTRVSLSPSKAQTARKSPHRAFLSPGVGIRFTAEHAEGEVRREGSF